MTAAAAKANIAAAAAAAAAAVVAATASRASRQTKQAGPQLAHEADRFGSAPDEIDTTPSARGRCRAGRAFRAGLVAEGRCARHHAQGRRRQAGQKGLVATDVQW